MLFRSDLGVTVCLGIEADAAYIKETGADAVILATGSVTSVPPIPGIENTIAALDAIDHPEKLGEKIIIAGGGLVGCEIAYDDAMKGKNVTIVEALTDIMAAGGATPLPNIMMIKAEFAARGIPVLTETRVSEIKPDGVIVTDKEGNTRALPADTVVNALGFKPVSKLAAELEKIGINTVSIGDALGAANILKAVADGYAAANSI